MTNRPTRTGGPLEPFRREIEVHLGHSGYSASRVGILMLLAAHLSWWMADQHLECHDLTEAVIAQFFKASRRSWCRSPRSLAPVLAYLRARGTVPAVARKEVGRTPAEVALWGSFQRWCVDQRGLKPATVEMYVERAEACLRSWRPDGEVVVGELDASVVLSVVRGAAETLPSPSLRSTVTALRSLLQFLYVTGRVQRPLLGAVPALKGRVKMTLPSPLSEEVAYRLVASCDTATATGRRDATILVVLVRLGLRAGEVASLCLDDLDWRRGEVRVAGKGDKVEVLPLPVDVGEAVASYLSAGRPPTPSRALFVKVVAPFGPMSPDGIGAVVRLSCDRAGVPRFGPHRLRHLVGTATLLFAGRVGDRGGLLGGPDVVAHQVVEAVVGPPCT